MNITNVYLRRAGITDEKACTMCEEIKPIEEFSFCNREKGYRHPRCKECIKIVWSHWDRMQRKTCIGCGISIAGKHKWDVSPNMTRGKNFPSCTGCGGKTSYGARRCWPCELRHRKSRHYGEEQSKQLKERWKEGKMTNAHSAEANHKRSETWARKREPISL